MIDFIRKKMAIDTSYSDFLTDRIFREQLSQQDLDNLRVYIFEQSWGNTSGGFQDIGGTCGVQEVTVVFYDRLKKVGFVYFNGKFAYKIDKNFNTTKFYEDLVENKVAGKKDYLERYKGA